MHVRPVAPLQEIEWEHAEVVQMQRMPVDAPSIPCLFTAIALERDTPFKQPSFSAAVCKTFGVGFNISQRTRFAQLLDNHSVATSNLSHKGRDPLGSLDKLMTVSPF